MKIENARLSLIVLLVSLTVLAPFATLTGCAKESRSVRQETVANPATTASTSTTTYVEKETVKEESGSVFGTVVDVAGEILALPFRLVAGIFRFIF